MDPVSQILQIHHVSAQIFHNAKYCGDFNVNTSKSGKIPFHIVTTGNCFLTLPNADNKKVLLQAGDMVILPHSAEHSLCNKFEPQVAENSTQSQPFAEAKELQGTGLVCGYMEFDHLVINPIIAALPQYIVIKSTESPWCDHLLPMIKLLMSESLRDGLGVQVTLNRLIDVIFVLIVREFIQLDDHQSGIMAALANKKISLALSLIHDDLSKEWTVETLAEKVAMSRSDFAKKFKQYLAQTPKHYLTQIRMESAYRDLKDTSKSMFEIADTYGYSSEAAFSKAFKKLLGTSPGAVRKLSA